MQFIIRGIDGENKLAKRMEVRPDHLANMNVYMDHILLAGGLLDEEGKMKGSLIVAEFESRDVLDEYLASEPYIKEKVWETVEVEVMNVVLLDRKKF